MRFSKLQWKMAVAAAGGGLLLGIPLAGVLLFGEDMSKFMEFPPKTTYVRHSPFSLPIFIGFSFLILVYLFFLWIFPFIKNHRQNCSAHRERDMPVQTDKRWRWILASGLVLVSVSWLIAWADIKSLRTARELSFTPLWIGYILTVNAISLRKKGTCLLMKWKFMIYLFILSSAFWWFFEYLNRFVQNWHYSGVENYSSLEYFLRASAPFSTVLPAVLSTAELLLSTNLINRYFTGLPPIKVNHINLFASFILLSSMTGLFLIGIFPGYLFPLLWLSPLFIILSFHLFEQGEKNVFIKNFKSGDWRLFVSLNTAALICGFFWEMWNFHSFPKWEYSVPFVACLHIFEMPLVGYAGYLPFGIECFLAAAFFWNSEITHKLQ